MIKYKFGTYPLEGYATWRDGRLFCQYLNLDAVKLLLDDKDEEVARGELEKIARVLDSRPLPMKFKFFRSLADGELRDTYKKRFLVRKKSPERSLLDSLGF